MPEFTQSVDLPVPAELVLARLTLAGVNAELWPLVRMTAPRDWAERSILEAPTGVPLFASWILLFGLLPIDRHRFRLTAVFPGEGFDEDSTSLLNARWQHCRRVLPVPGGCRVSDTVRYRSRLPLLGQLLRPVYRMVFAWRHRRLRAACAG